MIKRLEKTEQNLPFGIVLIHLYLLTDNTLLLFDRLLCKVRMIYKVEKYFQRAVKIVRAGEKIAGLVKRRVCIGICACFRIKLKCVQLLAFKQLVLKKERYSLGDACKAFSLYSKFRVHRTVVSAENSVT